MVRSQQRELVGQYITAYNRFDIDAMVALLTPDVQFENVIGGQVTNATSGVAEFRHLAEQAKHVFAERSQSITELEFGQASLRVQIAWRGVFAVDIPDGPAAGAELELVGESEFEFVGDRISRIVDRS